MKNWDNSLFLEHYMLLHGIVSSKKIPLLLAGLPVPNGVDE